MVAIVLGLLARVPWQAWLVAGVLASAGAFHLYATNAAYRAGRAETIKAITDANNAAKGKANEGIKDVDACFAAGGYWNRDRGVCIPAGG